MIALRLSDKEAAVVGSGGMIADGFPHAMPATYLTAEELTSADSTGELHLRTRAAAATTPATTFTTAEDDNGRLEHVERGTAVRQSSKQQHYFLAAKLSAIEHALGSSMLLTLSPLYLLINQTTWPVLCRQSGVESTPLLLLPPAGANADAVPPSPFHWPRPDGLRHVLFSRGERGSQWSGGVPLEYIVRHNAPASGSRIVLPLRNLEEGSVEFVRLSIRRLAGRSSFVVSLCSESGASAPLVLQNHTRHELTFKQSGVAFASTLPPGGSCPYAWDEPSGRHALELALPSSRASFRCRTGASYSERRGGVHMRVVSEATVTRIVLTGRSSAPVASPLRGAATTPAAAVAPAPPHLGVPDMAAAASTDADLVAASPEMLRNCWKLHVQIPKLGVSVLDERPRELLYLSLRGLRLDLCRLAAGPEGATRRLDTTLAVASVQLDYQAPQSVRDEFVLLRAGVASRYDALELHLASSEMAGMTVVHDARAVCHEASIRVDEEVLFNVVSSVLKAFGTPIAQQHAIRGAAAAAPSEADVGLDAEARAVAQLDNIEGGQTYVQQLRIQPLRVLLSLRLAPTPLVTGAGPLTAMLVRGFRAVGSTLLNAEGVPVRLPELRLARVMLPVGGLARELRQFYSRALLQQAYKLLPSSAVFGDPYGQLRKLRNSWESQRREMRHASWAELPSLVAIGTGQLVQSLLSSALGAGGKSSRALSKVLAAALDERSRATPRGDDGVRDGKDGANDEIEGEAITLGFAEALFKGVGGLAVEAARGQMVVRNLAPSALPFGLECALLTAAMPVGLGMAARRLALLSAVGSLSLIRSSLDAFRALTIRSTVAPTAGRARAPRILGPRELLKPSVDPGVMAHGNALLASLDAEYHAPLAHIACGGTASKVALLTSERLICVGQQQQTGGAAAASARLIWSVALPAIVELQQEEHAVCVISVEDDTRVRRLVSVDSRDDAAQLMEMMRLTALNSAGLAFEPESAKIV